MLRFEPASSSRFSQPDRTGAKQMRPRTCILAGVALIVMTFAMWSPVSPAHSQQADVVGTRSILGPSMMGPLGFQVMCSPTAAGFSNWSLERIEKAVKPSEAQRSALEALKIASVEADEMIRAACPGGPPRRSVGRLEVMEKRLQAALAAVKIVRPAFDDFYRSLDDKQKALFDAAGTRRWRLWPGRQSKL